MQEVTALCSHWDWTQSRPNPEHFLQKKDPIKGDVRLSPRAQAVGGCAGITHMATLPVQHFNPFLGHMGSELLCHFGAQGYRNKAGKQRGCLRRRVGLLAALTSLGEADICHSHHQEQNLHTWLAMDSGTPAFESHSQQKADRRERYWDGLIQSKQLLLEDDFINELSQLQLS